MEKDDAIYTLERLAHTEAKWPGTEETLEALDMAVKALRMDHFREATNMVPGAWISVGKKLPEEKQRVIVRCEKIGTTVGWILWGEWMTDLGHGCTGVSHWMPLPKPPEM